MKSAACNQAADFILEPWSGRDLPAGFLAGNLNATGAHKPPWRIAFSTY